jgi:3-deoxy-D-manno-octulosonic-acid transferase
MYPRIPVVLTFFSPSGYELRKNYSYADAVFYLPMDTRRNAVRFIEMVRPSKVIFVKYEFWRNYLGVLKSRGIPVYLISAIFREDQHFFKSWGGYFRGVLNNFEHLFVQDSGSEMLLKKIGVNNVTVCGDTRFDRVKEVTGTSVQIKSLELFSEDSVCMVAGSTWPADEEILAGFMNMTKSGRSGETVISKEGLPVKLVIAPHEVDQSHITKILTLFNDFKIVKFSEVKNLKLDDDADEKPVQSLLKQADIFIIDTIGILSVAYRYGSMAYIGGGFGTGIHNTLEAASYGIPVVFGPEYHKFKEAKDLIANGGAWSVNSFESFTDRMIKFINQPGLLKSSGEVCKEYVEKNVGATSAILASIYPRI